MSNISDLEKFRQLAVEQTAGGPPTRTSNAFFGVGPITDATAGEVESRKLRFEFERWVEQNYRKLDDAGRDLGPFTVGELSRSMHRGYPADKILCDMMREIHRYFGFPKENQMAVGLGGGHSGYTTCLLHLIDANDHDQIIYIDTPRPETVRASAAGFFRQSWASQLVELMQKSADGNDDRLRFASSEGAIPPADTLEQLGVRLFVGVGHETTGATTYTQEEIGNLLEWLSRDPENRHAILDVTSMLGAMPWREETVSAAMAKICMFTPFQKAVGGVSGYFIASFTPEALALIERNQKEPTFAIPRQLKLAAPVDPKQSVSGERSVRFGPFFDPQVGRMLGGVINTYSILAFAETTFGLLRSERRVGPISDLNRKSSENRDVIDRWIATQSLLQLAVENPDNRGTAVTLLKIDDPEIADPAVRARIIARSKQLLGYEGITHPNGEYEFGLDVARYVNAFPGTPGDYRAWIGGIRAPKDVVSLLENVCYAYKRAKIVVLEEEIAKAGQETQVQKSSPRIAEDADPARTVLICDPVGRRSDADGLGNILPVADYIRARGGFFHRGQLENRSHLTPGRIHFFYEPGLSAESPQAEKGKYDAVVTAPAKTRDESILGEWEVWIGADAREITVASCDGGNRKDGLAPSKNTTSLDSLAAARIVFNALLKVLPDDDGAFDTQKDLKNLTSAKLKGKCLAVVGYGNVGRHVAKLAQAFGMNVSIYSREQDRELIMSEGFSYAASPLQAAKGADVLSVDADSTAVAAASKPPANFGLVDAQVFDALGDGAVLINFDRGGVVDIDALDLALASGKLSYAAIDADLFRKSKTGELFGPMLPYLAIGTKHPRKFFLLPHTAADTDHISWVAGAVQVIDKIVEALAVRRPTKLDRLQLAATAGKMALVVEARTLAEELAAIWGSLAVAFVPDRRQEMVSRYGADLARASDRYTVLMREFSLQDA